VSGEEAHANQDSHPAPTRDIRTVPIADIHVGPQPRVKGIDDDHVAVLSECLDELPPAKLVETPENGLVLVQGHHTLCAYQNAGRTSIPAEIVAPPEDGDLLALAFHEDAKSGLAYTADDRDAFVAHLLRLYPGRSEREIGREAGRNQPTVARIRAELEASAQIKPTATRVGRGGYTYTVTRKERRQPGELPPDSEPLTERIFTPRERRIQAKLARYLTRLADGLEDQFGLSGWETAAEAAEACRLVLGDDEAAALAERLGPAAQNIVEVAVELGYREGAAVE